MLFARLRRTVALLVYPEIVRERLVWTPEQAAAFRRSAFFNDVSKLDRAEFDARYEPIKNIRDRALARRSVADGQVLDVVEEHLGSHIVARQEDYGAGDPGFGQGIEGDVGGAEIAAEGGSVAHGSLPVGVGASQGSGGAGSVEGECLPNQRDALITLALAMAAHGNVTHYAISMRALGKGDFFKNMIEKGADCRTQTATRLFAWFSDNWPSDLAWPRHIPRPQKSKREAA